MAFKQNELCGSLFDNTRKTNDRQPDMRGDCKVGGADFWLSAWVKSGANGDYLSLSFTRKDAPTPTGQNNTNTKSASFLAKGSQARAQSQQKQTVSKTKFEKDREEFEKMTGIPGTPAVPFEEEFDDDIPF